MASKFRESKMVRPIKLSIEKIMKASKEEIHKFFILINQLVKNYNLENVGYRLITNAGKDSNQEVPHLHFHLLAGKNLGKM